MELFKKRITCKKFYTYKTNTIDISGLSTGLSSEQTAGFNFKVGEFKINPEFVKASNKLQELDLMQYSICQSIKNISSNSKRDELLVRLVDIKIQMLKIAQQPNLVNDEGGESNNHPKKNKYITNDRTNDTINSQDIKKNIEHRKEHSFTKKRLHNIKNELNYTYDLLSEWEQKLILSQNPKEKKLCELEIDNLKKIIDSFQTEYNKLNND